MMSILMIIINFYTIKAFANEDDLPILIGVVKGVNEDGKGNIKKILVDGYIKGNGIYKGKIVAVITNETEVFINKKPVYNNISIKSEDSVYIVFSKAKTMTNPPQNKAKIIEVYKNEKYKKLNENSYNIKVI